MVDIDPNFSETLRKKPDAGEVFLSGEPYVLEYLKNIDSDVRSCVNERNWVLTRNEVLPEHVVLWRLKKVAGGPAGLIGG